ncbi:hypothetical protein ACQ902_003954 [Vibrio mimicus]
MNRAYNETSDRIEYAFKLKELEKAYIARSTYLCPNPLCRYPAIPCSYQKHNIPQPYYKYLEGHRPGCCFSPEFGGREVVDSKGRRHWVLPKVVEITLPKNDNELKGVSGAKSGATRAVISSSGASKGKSSGSGQGKLTSSVAAATLFYMQDVDKNKFEPLTLPDIKGTYRSVFQQIYSWNTIESYVSGHIFYADIRFTSELRVANDAIHVTLNVREPHTSKWFELKLCCSEWSNQERNGIVDELKRAQRFAAKAESKDEVASVYFIGKQNDSNKNVFECEYAQFLYVFTGNRVTLEKNYFGFVCKAEVPTPPSFPQLEHETQPYTVESQLDNVAKSNKDNISEEIQLRPEPIQPHQPLESISGEVYNNQSINQSINQSSKTFEYNNHKDVSIQPKNMDESQKKNLVRTTLPPQPNVKPVVQERSFFNKVLNYFFFRA